MTNRNYSSTAASTTLTSGINNSVTSMVVGATTGFPAAPFILLLDPDVAGQELVLVTAVAGTTLTVTRGYDSTSAASHSAGAVVKHAHAGIDFRDSRTHENASTGVHGVTGSVVGTSDSQSLTNKTLGSTNTLNGFTASKLIVSDGTGKLVASAASSTVPTFPSGTILGTTDTQTVTNKDLSSGTNTFPSALATDAEVTSAVSTHNAVTTAHGATGAVVGTTNTQTLTNKNLASATNTFPAAIPFASAAGTTTIDGTTVAAGGLVTVNITFPASRFAVAPIVTACVAGFVTNSGTIVVRAVDTITASGARIVCLNTGASSVSWTNLPLQWQAIQMASGSAAG